MHNNDDDDRQGQEFEGERFEESVPDHIEEADEEAADRASPLKAIRQHCLWCCSGSSHEVSLCVSKRCPLWTLRFGKRPTPELIAEVDGLKAHPLEAEQDAAKIAAGSRLKAIRARCLDCSGYNQAEVRRCQFGPDAPRNACSLHPYRMGTNPNRTLSEEQKAAAAERLRKLRGGEAAG